MAIFTLPSSRQLTMTANDAVVATYAELLGPIAKHFPIDTQEEYVALWKPKGVHTSRSPLPIDADGFVKLAPCIFSEYIVPRVPDRWEEALFQLIDRAAGRLAFHVYQLLIQGIFPGDADRRQVAFSPMTEEMSIDRLITRMRMTDLREEIDFGDGLRLFANPSTFNRSASADVAWWRILIGEIDQGYFDDSSAEFRRFMPDGIMSLIGRPKDDSPVGRTLLLKNTHNENCDPGLWVISTIVGEGSGQELRIDLGMNTAIALDWPGAIGVARI